MVKALYRTCDLIEEVFKTAGIALFSIMIAVISYEIVMRYIFNAPTFWAEPLARNAMIWMVLLGLAVGIRQKENICVDFIADRLTGKIRVIVALVRLALLLGFAGILLTQGSLMAQMNMRQTVTGLDIPAGIIQLVVPISATGMILFALELVARRDWDRF
ncbi:MAG: TRAP transporter small permease [Roseovarius sp.]|nr:TRAP transporter small permease [Roseovarius sp.]MCY4314529.1 TRAP transporter small permease [Roseovarius sp.]